MQANGFVTNRKDAATQVEVETTEVQPASVIDAEKAMLQSAQNFSFVRSARLLKLIYE